MNRDGKVASEEEAMAERDIPELLAEQVEAADVLLINKVDLADVAAMRCLKLFEPLGSTPSLIDK